ncbi:zinc-dependent alcohol dehydrogenase [Propionibacteriaceae bacterium Y1685]
MIDQEMNRAVTVQRDHIGLVTESMPVPNDHEVRVTMRRTGVCGSDTHAAAGHHPFVPLPYRPGHEVVGVISQLGARVEKWRIGDRVTVEPPLPCAAQRAIDPTLTFDDCKPCRTGRSNLCERLVFFGCGHTQGGMADEFTAPADRLYAIPDALDDDQAALIEPLSTPVHAVRLAGVQDATVAILGCGTIGLLVMAAARHAGARTIVMTDPLAEKRERAKRLGADHVLEPGPDVAVNVRAFLGESADVVFDCVAIQATVTSAVEMALKGGTVVIVGVPTGPVEVPLPIIQDQQVRIQGSATYLREDYDEATEILLAGKVSPDDVITGRYPIEEAAEAFAAASSGQHVKVLITAAS